MDIRHDILLVLRHVLHEALISWRLLLATAVAMLCMQAAIAEISESVAWNDGMVVRF